MTNRASLLPLAPQTTLMRASAAARWAQISKSTWHNWVAQGRVPPGIKLSPGVTVWDMAAVTAALMNGEAR
jgi:predicted DNA-binding transcriptional regulator AlpA